MFYKAVSLSNKIFIDFATNLSYKIYSFQALFILIMLKNFIFYVCKFFSVCNN